MIDYYKENDPFYTFEDESLVNLSHPHMVTLTLGEMKVDVNLRDDKKYAKILFSNISKTRLLFQFCSVCRSVLQTRWQAVSHPCVLEFEEFEFSSMDMHFILPEGGSIDPKKGH